MLKGAMMQHPAPKIRSPFLIAQTYVDEIAGFTVALQEHVYELGDEWRMLEQKAVGTLFQSYAWSRAWCLRAAEAFGETPVIVTGRDRYGNLAFVLPFALIRRYGTTLLTWLGQDHAGYGAGIYRRDAVARLGADAIRHIIARVHAERPEIGAVYLTKQPLEWDGVRNPLARLKLQLLANEILAFDLIDDFTSLYNAHYSGKKRGTDRRATKQLQKLGALEMGVVSDPAQRIKVFQTFQAQKSKQLAAKNDENPFSNPSIEAFYKELLASDEDGFVLEIVAMRVDGQIVAVDIAMRFQDRLYGLNRSMTGGEMRRYSPGRLLNTFLVERACRTGCKVFDLGPGAAPYKDEWGSYEVNCFATILPLRPAGFPAAAVLSLPASSKHALIKILRRHPALHAGARALHQTLKLLANAMLDNAMLENLFEKKR